MKFKKGEIEILPILGLIALIGVLVFIVAPSLGVKLGAGTIGGFSSISVTNILTNPGGSLPSGEYWLLNFIAENPRSDTLYGSAGDGALTYGNYKLGDGFSLKVEPTATQACTAGLSVQTGEAKNIYQINWFDATFSYYASDSELNNWCYSQNGGFARVQKSCNFLVNCEHRCYKKYAVQELGQQVTQTNIAYQEKITLTNMKTGKASIVSMSPLSTEALLTNPDNTNQIIGKVAWNGNLINGAPCTYPFSENVIPTYTSAQGWFLIDQTTYSNYISTYNDVNNYVGLSYAQLQQKVDAFNTRSYQMAIPTSNAIFSQATFSGNDITGGQVSLPQSNPIIFPSLSIYISTAFLPKIAIVQESGIPQLSISTGQQTGYLGDVLTYQGTVKNIGQATGRFTITSSSCTAGQSVSIVPSTTGDVAPGSSVPITLTVTSGGSNSGIKSCVITATAVNDPTKTSSSTVSANWLVRCLKSCGTNTHLDSVNCVCVCDLPGTAGVNWFWNSDQTACSTQCVARTCAYGQNQATCECNPKPDCTLSCPTKYIPNEPCNSCVCGLSVAGTPNGYFLNTTACEYQQIQGGGQGGITIEQIIGLLVILGALVGVAAIAYWYNENR